MSLLRILLLFFLGWIVWRLLRPASRTRTQRMEKEKASENMTACAWCGVYVPEHEMIRDKRGQKYCCPAHLSLGEPKQRPSP